MAERRLKRGTAVAAPAAPDPELERPVLSGELGGAAHVPELDRLIHERVRLGIVSALAVHGPLPFADLKAVLEVTDGNLAAHARRLEEAGYIHGSKTAGGRAARTEYRLTDVGRQGLEDYLEHMEALIDAMRRSGATGRSGR